MKSFFYISIFIFLSIIGRVIYMAGYQNGRVELLVTQQLLMPISYYLWLRDDRLEHVLQFIDQQIDYGIIDAVGQRRAKLLTRRNREHLDYALGQAFQFRSQYPYVLINTNELQNPLRMNFDLALQECPEPTLHRH